MIHVSFWMPDTYIWNDLTASPHIGGREWSVVCLAEDLAKLNYGVTIFCPTPEAKVKNDVFYLPPKASSLNDAEIAIFLNGYDSMFVARHPKVVVWLPTGLPNLLSYQKRLDAVVASSPNKVNAIEKTNPWLSPEKIIPIYSGINLEEYTRESAEKVPNRLLWCSSRDRGLHHLLRWWPTLREAIPTLSLRVTYDPRTMQGHRWQQEVRAEIAHQVEEGLRQPGITDLGAVSREVLVREQKETALWACPVEFFGGYETGSFTLLEFSACLTPMLCSEDPSLIELGRDVAYFLPTPGEDEPWIQEIISLLSDESKRRAFEGAQKELALRYTWTNVAQQWHTLLLSLA